MPRSDSVTSKQMDFVYDMVWKNMEPMDAYALHYKTEGVAKAHVRKRIEIILEKPHVKQYMERMIAEKKNEQIGDEHFVMRGLIDMANNAKNESSRLKALELIGKRHQMFKEHIVYEDSEHSQAADEAWKNRRRINDGEKAVDLNVLEFGKDKKESIEEEEKQNGTDKP